MGIQKERKKQASKQNQTKPNQTKSNQTKTSRHGWKAILSAVKDSVWSVRPAQHGRCSKTESRPCQAATKSHTKDKCQNAKCKKDLGSSRLLICNRKARKPQRKHAGLKRTPLSSKNHRPSQSVIYMQRQIKTGFRFARIQKLSDSDLCAFQTI